MRGERGEEAGKVENREIKRRRDLFLCYVSHPKMLILNKVEGCVVQRNASSEKGSGSVEAVSGLTQKPLLVAAQSPLAFHPCRY